MVASPEMLAILKQADDEREKKKKEYSFQKIEPNSFEELEQQLMKAGNARRKEKEYTIEKGVHKGEIKQPRLTWREITNILEKYVCFRLIADDNTESEQALLYFYNASEGIYSSNTIDIDKLINCVDNQSTSKMNEEIKNKLRIESKVVSRTVDSNLVIVKNGVFDRNQKKLLPFSSNYVFTTKINTAYNCHATQEPTFDDWWKLSDWFDDIAGGQKDKRELLQQVIYASVDPNTNHEAAIFLVDNEKGRSGKSTFENLLMNLVGKNNCGQLRLKEFEEDFKLAQVNNKALIIGDDNEINSFHADSSNFKSLVTGETMLLNPKGKTPFYSKFNALVVQSMNGIPRFGDHTDAHFRRIRIVKFTKHYEATPKNRKIKDEYINDNKLLEWLLHEALNADKVTNFITTQESKEIIGNLKEENDPIYYFVKRYVSKLKSNYLPSFFLYQYFRVCMQEEGTPTNLGKRSFVNRIKTILLYEGWKYDSGNKAPTEERFSHEDWLKYSESEGSSRYPYKLDRTKRVAMFYRE